MRKFILIFFFCAVVIIPVSVLAQKKNNKTIKSYGDERFLDGGCKGEKACLVEEIHGLKFPRTDSVVEKAEYEFYKNKKRIIRLTKYSKEGYVVSSTFYQKGKILNSYKFLKHDSDLAKNTYIIDTLGSKKLVFPDTIYTSLIYDRLDSAYLSRSKENKKPYYNHYYNINEAFDDTTKSPYVKHDNVNGLDIKTVGADSKIYYVAHSKLDHDVMIIEYVSFRANYPEICIERRNDKLKYRELNYYSSGTVDYENLDGYRLLTRIINYVLEDGCSVSETQYFINEDYDDQRRYSFKPVEIYKDFTCKGYVEFMEIDKKNKVISHWMTATKKYK